jgi:uncharacterized protein
MIAPAFEIEKRPLAPWWHTAIVLLLFLGSFALARRSHLVSGADLPGLRYPFSFYLLAMAGEWLIVLVIWLGIRRRGVAIGDLVSGRRSTPRAFLKDLGLAAGFLLLCVPLVGILGWLLHAREDTASIAFAPGTVSQAIVWIFVAATAGFAEEFIFRGYLMRQFKAWTNSVTLAVILQGLIFGFLHGYSMPMRFAVAAEGCLLGLLALWRRSLRPGMLAHGMQDAGLGLLIYFLK